MDDLLITWDCVLEVSCELDALLIRDALIIVSVDVEEESVDVCVAEVVEEKSVDVCVAESELLVSLSSSVPLAVVLGSVLWLFKDAVPHGMALPSGCEGFSGGVVSPEGEAICERDVSRYRSKIDGSKCVP